MSQPHEPILNNRPNCWFQAGPSTLQKLIQVSRKRAREEREAAVAAGSEDLDDEGEVVESKVGAFGGAGSNRATTCGVKNDPPAASEEKPKKKRKKAKKKGSQQVEGQQQEPLAEDEEGRKVVAASSPAIIEVTLPADVVSSAATEETSQADGPLLSEEPGAAKPRLPTKGRSREHGKPTTVSLAHTTLTLTVDSACTSRPPRPYTCPSTLLLQGSKGVRSLEKKECKKGRREGRKRTKTRSKQKNLRKDRRPMDQRPEHLRPDSADFTGRVMTEETKRRITGSSTTN